VWADRLPSSLRTRITRATERAVSFLRRSQRIDGAFVPLWFGNQHEPQEENPVFGTARVLKGLAALKGTSATTARPIAGRARAYLLAVQNPDGGWGGAAGVPSSVEETAVALAGLRASAAAGEDEDDQRLARAEAWLLTATDGLRSFEPRPIGLYFAKLWYSEALYPLILTTDALTRSYSRSRLSR